MKKYIHYEIEVKDYKGIIGLMRRFNELLKCEPTEEESQILDIYTNNIDRSTVHRYRAAWRLLGCMANKVEAANVHGDDEYNTQLFYLHQTLLAERWHLEEIFRDFETVGVYVD